jgi:hypothetical protein
MRPLFERVREFMWSGPVPSATVRRRLPGGKVPFEGPNALDVDLEVAAHPDVF